MTKMAYLALAGLLFLATGIAGVVALCGVIAFIYGLDFLAKFTSKPDQYSYSDDNTDYTTLSSSCEGDDDTSGPYESPESDDINYDNIAGNIWNSD